MKPAPTALVLFNLFYQPDIDIRTMRVSPQAELSTSAELLLRLPMDCDSPRQGKAIARRLGWGRNAG